MIHVSVNSSILELSFSVLNVPVPVTVNGVAWFVTKTYLSSSSVLSFSQRWWNRTLRHLENGGSEEARLTLDVVNSSPFVGLQHIALLIV